MLNSKDTICHKQVKKTSLGLLIQKKDRLLWKTFTLIQKDGIAWLLAKEVLITILIIGKVK